MAAVVPIPLQPFPQQQPLLPNPYHQLDQVNYHEAYNHCLQSKAEAGTTVTRLMFARCIGYLILEAPTSAGRDIISDEILECKGNRDDMEALAQLYIHHLLCLCELKVIYYKSHLWDSFLYGAPDLDFAGWVVTLWCPDIQ